MDEVLFDIRMNDGSRHFGDLPQTALWYDVRDHASKLEGVVVTSFITDHVTECWIDFSYSGHAFSMNDQFGDYWFFVNDPACVDDILQRVLSHFRLLLGPHTKSG